MKTFGQIAYEANQNGGIQNFGKWDHAPELVRQVHDDMAAAIIKRFVRRVELIAEKNMIKTGKLEGSHYAAMKLVLKESGIRA